MQNLDRINKLVERQAVYLEIVVKWQEMCSEEDKEEGQETAAEEKKEEKGKGEKGEESRQ